eukprot:TRINITY_DN3710_c0_g1_i1.p1 TRINITY_DN3710_c0_g1~~TRINITY_DN3710_c0_g1_i1.p1  ORF type:complete len:754 (+),score=158.93 TRINITY_DN3710_c0_g1_i1:48-2309(+)
MSGLDYSVKEFLRECKQTKDTLYSHNPMFGGPFMMHPDHNVDRLYRLEQKFAVLDSRVSFLESTWKRDQPSSHSPLEEEKISNMLRLLTRAESIIQQLTVENQKLRSHIDSTILNSEARNKKPEESKLPARLVKTPSAISSRHVHWAKTMDQNLKRTASAPPAQLPTVRTPSHLNYSSQLAARKQTNILEEEPKTETEDEEEEEVEPPVVSMKRTPVNLDEQTTQSKQPPKINVVYPAGYDPAKRRYSVSSESYNPELFRDVKLKVIPKSDDVRQRIRNTVRGNVLFKHLDDDQLDEVVDAMDEITVEPHQIVIKQGSSFADDNNMYLINDGELEVLYGEEVVATLTSGGAFGEIALMYGCPRTATVRTRTQCRLWTLDRNAFRRILMEESIRRRKLYESVLAKVPIFKSLLPYERSKVADALECVTFKDGTVIIAQGSTDTDKFYIIEKGEVVCTKVGLEGSSPVEALRLRAGDYFGELALLLNEPRQATVTSVGTVKCLTIGREHFNQVMGPCEDILRRNIGGYKSYEQLITALKSPSLQSNSDHDIDEDLGIDDLPSGREDIVKYIIQTESDYVYDLTQTEGYYMAMAEHAESLSVTPKMIDAIFSNAREILRVHKSFNKSLKELEKKGDLNLGESFLGLMSSLSVYEQFIQDYDKSQSELNECSKHTAFSDFLMMCHKEAGEDLETLLHRIYNKIPQMLSLLRSLLEATETSHADKNTLAMAIRKLEGINTTLKNLKQASKNREPFSFK